MLEENAEHSKDTLTVQAMTAIIQDTARHTAADTSTHGGYLLHILKQVSR